MTLNFEIGDLKLQDRLHQLKIEVGAGDFNVCASGLYG